ncbi:flagellar biosynthesis protein [bacterium]|nr:flagellar biosynthesis protein [bacterium]
MLEAGQSGVGSTEPSKRQERGVPGEFDSALQKVLDQGTAGQPDLNQIRSPLKFSAHASQRLAERKIQIDPSMMAKVNEAIDKAASKGLEDTLVLTPNAALIVSASSRTVITAMDRSQLQGNVFTNIDGAVVI